MKSAIEICKTLVKETEDDTNKCKDMDWKNECCLNVHTTQNDL